MEKTNKYLNMIDTSRWKGRQVKFKPGNKAAAADNLTEHESQRRLEGLVRAWETKRRMSNGEKVVTTDEKKKREHRKRVRLRETVALEARELQEIARKNAQAGMERLNKIIEDPASKDSDAIQAIALTFDRAYGKANQVNVNATIDANGKPNEVSQSELDQRIAAALKRIEAITGRTAEAAPKPEQPADIRKLN